MIAVLAKASIVRRVEGVAELWKLNQFFGGSAAGVADLIWRLERNEDEDATVARARRRSP